MSLRSMTGYGRGASRLDGVSVEVEISSVNRKQLDLLVNLPRTLQVLEPRVVDEVGRALTRGRVTIDVRLTRLPHHPTVSVVLNEALAEEYVGKLKQAARKLDVHDDLGLSHLLALPDVLTIRHVEEDVDLLWPTMKAALGQALTRLVRMRTAEGRALGKDLAVRFAALASRVVEIERSAPGVAARYRAQLIQRLREAGLNEEQFAEDRLLREVILFADRVDIAEEITRLKSHLDQAKKQLRSSEAVGRALDFLAQEMFREINTIGSKANDAGIVREVVEFKAELERIREQVQNIE
jgi:uncharacterized protein (TIGR00255 family)